MLAPRDLVQWAGGARGIDLSQVDWKREESSSQWQGLIDAIAKSDRAIAVKARDGAHAQILSLAKGSFWERVAWPGHAEAESSREVLTQAAATLPKGAPASLDWVIAVERTQATIAAARELLVKAGILPDVAIADVIIGRLSEAIAAAKHALAAPELVEATLPAPPAPPTAPAAPATPPASSGGWGWLLWLGVGALVLDALDEDPQQDEY